MDPFPTFPDRDSLFSVKQTHPRGVVKSRWLVWAPSSSTAIGIVRGHLRAGHDAEPAGEFTSKPVAWVGRDNNLAQV